MRIAPGAYSEACIIGFEMPLEGVGIIRHVGLLADPLRRLADGYPSVIHSSKHFRCVAETTMSNFAAKALTPVRYLGYPGALPPALVLQRARSRIGEAWTPWRNCEHFATWAHGLEPHSPQLASLVRPRWT